MLAGTLSMYLGEPPERVDVPVGGLIHIEPGTVLQTVNHGSRRPARADVYGMPPESENAELLELGALDVALLGAAGSRSRG